jgi:hypothetical protein
VGSFISATGFHLSNIRPFADKADERDFAEEDVYFNNDFNSMQRRARIAMLTLSGLLLVALAFAVRSAFGTSAAQGTLLLLAIDPTVAAHLPVVMTDLPVSLLCATAVVLLIDMLSSRGRRSVRFAAETPSHKKELLNRPFSSALGAAVSVS